MGRSVNPLGLLEYEGDEHVIMHRLVAGFALRMDADEHAAALCGCGACAAGAADNTPGRAPIQLAPPYAVGNTCAMPPMRTGTGPSVGQPAGY